VLSTTLSLHHPKEWVMVLVEVLGVQVLGVLVLVKVLGCQVEVVRRS
jgi:hypothetical protein